MRNIGQRENLTVLNAKGTSCFIIQFYFSFFFKCEFWHSSYMSFRKTVNQKNIWIFQFLQCRVQFQFKGRKLALCMPNISRIFRNISKIFSFFIYLSARNKNDMQNDIFFSSMCNPHHKVAFCFSSFDISYKWQCFLMLDVYKLLNNYFFFV